MFSTRTIFVRIWRSDTKYGWLTPLPMGKDLIGFGTTVSWLYSSNNFMIQLGLDHCSVQLLFLGIEITDSKHGLSIPSSRWYDSGDLGPTNPYQDWLPSICCTFNFLGFIRHTFSFRSCRKYSKPVCFLHIGAPWSREPSTQYKSSQQHPRIFKHE